jgi:septal ring factor EnvC (AmiA/AmiB activator)
MTIALGTLLLLFAMVFGFIALFRKTSPFKNPALIVGLAIFAGFGLLLSDRITEFTIPNVGTLKAATRQATANADTIAKLKERVENQSATVDLVASQAAKAQQLSETAATQTKQVDERLNKINAVITDATATLEKLKEEEEFVGLVVAAQSDDRTSYDRLKKMADEQNNRFAQLAGQAWLTIYEAHSSPKRFSSALEGRCRPGDVVI